MSISVKGDQYHEHKAAITNKCKQRRIIMNEAQVISVNPAEKTLGERLFKEDKFARISRTLSPRRVGTSAKKVLNLALGLNSRVNGAYSAKMLFLRFLCGSVIILSVLLPMHPSDIMAFNFDTYKLMMCILGISMVFGFLSRLTALSGMAWFGYMLYSSIMGGNADILAGATTMIMAIFCVLGPGSYSIDQLTRRGIYKLFRRSPNKRAHHDNGRFDYRAYSSVERRVG